MQVVFAASEKFVFNWPFKLELTQPQLQLQ